MRAFSAAFRLQLRLIRSDPDYLMPLVTVPLFTVTFLDHLAESGRRDGSIEFASYLQDPRAQ